jgi:RecB family exonuclease/shikimate kinase
VIPVLIGLTGAGKTEVGRRVAAATHGYLLSIDDLRERNGSAGMGDLALAALECASRGQVIIECSGAADEFEELLTRLLENGKRPFVILLKCCIRIAMERIRNRRNWAPPREGGSWAPHLRWTAVRLRQVPADLTIATETADPQRIAERIVVELRRAKKNDTRLIPIVPVGRFTFSQLATYDVCPLAYRYKYIDRQRELLETEAMFLGKRLHEVLFVLYRQGIASIEEARVFLRQRVLDTLPSTTGASQRQNLIEQAAAILEYHYSRVYRHDHAQTLALEKTLALRLTSNLTFVGGIDRIALARSGTYEVIDYKTSARKKTSRPRIPDLLQVAAYGAMTLLEYKLPALLSYRHLLPTGEKETVPVHRKDLPRIRAALTRWIDRCIRDKEYGAQPGRHCASCQFNPICQWAAHPPQASAIPISEDGS